MMRKIKTLGKMALNAAGLHADNDSAEAAVSEAGFSHKKAQKYELFHAHQTIREHFQPVYESVEADRRNGGIWQSANDQWFRGNKELFDKFVAHIRVKKCLEVGSGPFGYLGPCTWIKDRAVIDPLIDEYRSYQLSLLNKTFFTPDIKTYAIPAEEFVPELANKIDGAIICRNALDHCEDPLQILGHIANYAQAGCYLLLWTDIWHNDGLDDGHHNITKSIGVMKALIEGLGFDIINPSENIRDTNYIEFGCLAVKRSTTHAQKID